MTKEQLYSDSVVKQQLFVAWRENYMCEAHNQHLKRVNDFLMAELDLMHYRIGVAVEKTRDYILDVERSSNARPVAHSPQN